MNEYPSDNENRSPTIEEIGLAACEYSRSFILKGCTQLISNTYDALQRKSLLDSIYDMRSLCKEDSLYKIEMNSAINDFHRRITLSKKLSLGNCGEMAKMALDYVLRYAPSTNAEIYRIQGGDHQFLVIGREKNSHPNYPVTWGKNAYICDPWSNKVYPAIQYLTELKNYKYLTKDNGDYENVTEDFNRTRHLLVPVAGYSSENLNQLNSRTHLDSMITIYQQKMRITLEALRQLESKLQKIMDRLEKDYPDNSDKKNIIEEVSKELRKNIAKISEDIEEDYSQLDYDKLRSTAESSWKESVDSYQEAAETLSKNKTTLGKYKDENSFTAKAMRFFNIPTKTIRETKEALENTDEEIKKSFKIK